VSLTVPHVESSQIDAHLARRLVDTQFPQWSALPLHPVRQQGIDNRTFRLGAELSVRLPAAEWYALQVAKEQRWLPELRPLLPLPIPEPVAEGQPAFEYPYSWSVYRWIDGVPASEGITDWCNSADILAAFLVALHRVDPNDGPKPGPHNFFRGAPLSVYGEETAAAIEGLGNEIDASAVEAAWMSAVATTWTKAPQWFHGDVAPTNLLTQNGQLTAVIDFGTSGIGDPACDTFIAWTHLNSDSRKLFRRDIDVDNDTWTRGRGWALWKALITLKSQLETDNDQGATQSRRIINAVLRDVAQR
jgi:aminoglycoside phosphotransferase (APT) family kinase protein